MTMSNREHLISLAAVTALVAFSGLARADGFFDPAGNRVERSEVQSQPMTCAQALAFAWFRHQMELSDGVQENTVPYPAECEITQLAAKSEIDAGTYEESK
jgi:hypothetical protein